MTLKIVSDHQGPAALLLVPTQENRQQVLLPLIDLLNHHHAGTCFRIQDGAMRVKTVQAGGNECFTHYGNRRDVLDLALHYGHLDQSTPFE